MWVHPTELSEARHVWLQMDLAKMLNPISHPLLCRDLVPCDLQNPSVARHTSSPATPAAHPVSWAAPCIPSTAVGLEGK